MLNIEVVATTTYTYELTPDEEQKVKEMIKNNPKEFQYMADDEIIANAVGKLYSNGELSIFENDGRTVESDCSVYDFNFSEFNDTDSEDWIDNNGLREIIEGDDEDDE